MLKKNLIKMVNLLKGQKVEKVISGGSNGSMLVFNFGENDDYCVFVYCVWRLEQKKKILSGWNESCDAKTGNLTLQTRALKNEIVKDVILTDFFDLKILFNSGKVLNVFCDVTAEYEPQSYDMNWCVCDIRNNICYSVNRSSVIVTDKYSGN